MLHLVKLLLANCTGCPDYDSSLDIKLVVCDRIIGTNLKVSNLANAVVFAKHSILVLADSDVRVGNDYLQRVIQPFQNQNVGVISDGLGRRSYLSQRPASKKIFMVRPIVRFVRLYYLVLLLRW